MDAMLTTAALASAEKAINALLAYDPASRIALAQLAPNVLKVEITSPACTFFVAPADEGLRLLGHYEAEITTGLRGSLPALASLARSERVNLKDTGVEISGSTQFLEGLQKILKSLDIDWEEILSTFFGDILAHQCAHFLRGQFQWAKDRSANIQRLTAEFLTEELRVLPSKSELEFFYNQVDELKLDVDRLEARIDNLIARAHRV